MSSKNHTSASRLLTLVRPDPRTTREQVSEKLRLCFALFHDGLKMKRASIKRSFPSASDEEIEQKIILWLYDTPKRQTEEWELASWPRLK